MSSSPQEADVASDAQASAEAAHGEKASAFSEESMSLFERRQMTGSAEVPQAASQAVDVEKQAMHLFEQTQQREPESSQARQSPQTLQSQALFPTQQQAMSAPQAEIEGIGQAEEAGQRGPKNLIRAAMNEHPEHLLEAAWNSRPGLAARDLTTAAITGGIVASGFRYIGAGSVLTLISPGLPNSATRAMASFNSGSQAELERRNDLMTKIFDNCSSKYTTALAMKRSGKLLNALKTFAGPSRESAEKVIPELMADEHFNLGIAPGSSDDDMAEMANFWRNRLDEMHPQLIPMTGVVIDKA